MYGKTRKRVAEYNEYMREKRHQKGNERSPDPFSFDLEKEPNKNGVLQISLRNGKTASGIAMRHSDSQTDASE